MGLIRYAGTILRNPEGTLANDLNCCCDDTICPPCCARITSGALLDEQIHFVEIGDPTSLEGEIATTSGTRVVCKDDEITITFRTDPGMGTISPDAFATWDVVWELVSFSPDVGTFGSFEEHGYVDWIGNPVQEYTLVFRYNPCWNKDETGLGLIQVGFAALGLTHDVVLEVCPTQNCCDVDTPCEPCCYKIVDGFLEDFDWHFYFEVGDDLYVIISITPSRTNTRLTCVKEPLVVNVKIARRRPIPGFNVDVKINTGSFLYLDSDSPLATSEPDDGTPGEVIWLANSSRDYQAQMMPDCLLGDAAVITVTVRNNITGETNEKDIEFDACALGECPCCCPRWCTCDCELPVSEDACEENVTSTLAPDSGLRIDPAPQVFIENFRQERIGSHDFVTATGQIGEFDCDRWLVEQNGESEHVIECYNACNDPVKVCGKSTGLFLVPVQLSYCGVPFPLPPGLNFITVYRTVYPDDPSIVEEVRGKCGWAVGDFLVDQSLVGFLGGLFGGVNSYSMTNTCGGMREYYEHDVSQSDSPEGFFDPDTTWTTETEFDVSGASECEGDGIIEEEEP